MKTRDYIYNPCENTITITKAFAEALQNPNSDESKLFRAIKADNPSIVVRQRTHKTKSDHVNKNKNLSYENMKAFIELLPEAEDYLNAFNAVRAMASTTSLSPYSMVSKWFVKQFPLYRKDPMVYLYDKVAVIAPEQIFDKEEDAA